MRRLLVALTVVFVLLGVSVASAAVLAQSTMEGLARNVARSLISQGVVDADQYSYACARDSARVGFCKLTFYGGSVGRCTEVIRIRLGSDGYARSSGYSGNC